MPVIYDSKKIIPAPFATIQKNRQKTGGGEHVGSTLSITLKGKLLATRGSPSSSGVWWSSSGYPADESLAEDAKFASVLAKQTYLQTLFSTEGKTLEIQPYNGATPRKFNPRIQSVEFPDGEGRGGNWTEFCDYVITMEADDPDDNAHGVAEASEEWNIEPSDDKGITFRLTHSLSVTGKRTYDETGSLVRKSWENARLYVLNQMGLGLDSSKMEASGVLNATNLQAFNYARSQQLDEYAGTFRVTETWLAYDPQGGAAAVEEFTVNTRTDESQRTSVSIEGQIQGLEGRDNNTYVLGTTRYDNAETKWGQVNSSLFTRCQTMSGETLNSTPLNSQIGRNEKSGIINYNFEYDNRATPDVVGAVSQSVTVNDSNQADIFAAIPVLGRALGPVLQDISTKTPKKRSVSIEIAMPGKTISSTPTKPDVSAIVTANRPTGTQVFVDQDEESWSVNTGRYTRQIGYTYE